ncbi:hypothetical protein P153DRAFT_399404 [Dothidotthia symphoricarpi CBS 119687]|uniref:Uncharacterized protein n=1 Tax=Dothidotthia symphoricarpi CBS 119687 TaxID=1392245 RepID=A0A6A6A6E8_9PLEO|nr:uncharacterized protein P153DRAFT_399404 [Dothidotthia symphoricarpi CBS 119687]KAF2126644.1 hypothetical protein P153DRAFT_399404 [Dothidotthia symphoricarpi CBS 119687]
MNEPSGTLLRTHFRNALNGLPGGLPKYDQEGLLDGLCILLCRPLFLYAIAPRVRRESYNADSTFGEKVSQALQDSDKKCNDDKGIDIDISKLKVKIKWTANATSTEDIEDNSDGDGDVGAWATQLLYGDNVLVEGRQVGITREDSFVQSFAWFCDEVEFLQFQFRGQSLATPLKLKLKLNLKAKSPVGAKGGMKKKASETDRVVKKRKTDQGKAQKLTLRFPKAVWNSVDEGM